MSPISKPVIPNTWMRRINTAADNRYTSDGNSSSYSSTEENQRLDRQYVPSFMMNDDMGGRSYVDPWDMENYSFLRKQLEEVSISDNELSPAFESSQSDFYYVPLDNDGSPQYQYKHYIDALAYKDGISPQTFRNDAHGLMANIDEYDFYNEHLDSTFHLLNADDPYLGFSNPSRQSERSRFNNQDYQTYTPPSIIKDVPDKYVPNQVAKIRRRASVSFRPDTYDRDIMAGETLPQLYFKNKEKVDKDYKGGGKKSWMDVRIKLNRRKSFHDVSNNSDLNFSRLERRKSVLDHPRFEKWKPTTMEVLPEHHNEKGGSIPEIPTDCIRKPQKLIKEGILQNPENRSNRVGLNVSFDNDVNISKSNSQTNPHLVYIYETAKRRRKMFLPPITSPKIFSEEDYRCNRPEFQDAFSFHTIEQYLNRPTSRYTMTNYGHLKIDYSCSWNYLDKCIAQQICL